ncbi:hypothetical protein [Lonepinella sp. MS14437]|uniref:hypothetical protein n=1 Tax=Lonepinella sp. MS14437 TaxID=3003620 RepID=UPI0036D79424
MTQIPQSIIDFLQTHHVVSLTTMFNNELWAASCFYVFDEKNTALWVMTSQQTKHGRMMLQQAKIVGTIAGQPETIREIQGIQFTAYAKLIDDPNEYKIALAHYAEKHTMAKLLHTDIWHITFDELKFTSNKLLFAQKTYWKRTD